MNERYSELNRAALNTVVGASLITATVFIILVMWLHP